MVSLGEACRVNVLVEITKEDDYLLCCFPHQQLYDDVLRKKWSLGILHHFAFWNSGNIGPRLNIIPRLCCLTCFYLSFLVDNMFTLLCTPPPHQSPSNTICPGLFCWRWPQRSALSCPSTIVAVLSILFCKILSILMYSTPWLWYCPLPKRFLNFLFLLTTLQSTQVSQPLIRSILHSFIKWFSRLIFF